MSDMENAYVSLRNKYLPNSLKIVFILESPPAGHGYFYDPEGKTSEVLFRAFMKLLGAFPATKDEGLRVLAARGWLLVNPIYSPVNKLDNEVADKLILNNYENFVSDLNCLIKDKKTPVIIVKSNILRLLEKPLLEDGFNVINDGLLVPFPLHYHAKSFEERVRSLLSKVTT